VSHPEASTTAARALDLYRRYPFTRPADLADAAVLKLAAQAFVGGEVSQQDFRHTWDLVRVASPDDMTPDLLEQWLQLVRTIAQIPQEKDSELVRAVQCWSGREAESQTEGNASPPPAEPVASLSPHDLLQEIRKGYDELLHRRQPGILLPQVEIDAIEETLRAYDPERHPRHLLGYAFFSLGRCFTEIEDDVTAERCYRQSLACNPEHADAHYNLGNVLLRRGERDAAEEQFRLVLSAEPDNSRALRNLTYVLAQSGRLKPAIEIAATTALTSADPASPAARLLELCAHYDGWTVARPVVEEILKAAHGSSERVARLRELLVPLLKPG
jgi:tetratricopeptide (TPR) repeat protein